MGSMLNPVAMANSMQGGSTDAVANNSFPPHRPPPAPSQPKCPPCFAAEPVPPEPSPPASEPFKPEAPGWCGCWQWSSCECWQWYGAWQWKSQRHSWKSYGRAAKSYRQQASWYDWQYSKNTGSSWHSWRSWTGNEGGNTRREAAWQWQYGDGGNTRREQPAPRSSCCGCWQRRRTGNATRRSQPSSPQARLQCGLPEGDYSDLLFREITPEDYELLLRLDESVARPTASKESVDGLPIARWEQAEGQVCTVCLDPFRLNDTISLLPRCKHLFHKDCVSKWLLERHRKCPLCSVEVFPA